MEENGTVGIRELRQNLSVYINRVQNGEVLQVTERGKPVAILGPLPGRGTRLERMASEGLIKRASRQPSSLDMPATPPGTPRESLTSALRRLRSNER